MSLVIGKDALLSLPREAGELYLPKQVPRLSAPPSPIVFLRKYVMPNLPVVIENGVSHWPALKKWSNEYLRKILGHKEITVSVTPNGYADAPVGDKFVLPDEKEMKFEEFLTMLEQNSKHEIAYIQKQNSSFLDEFSELIPDAAKDIPWASETFGKLPDAVNFWMGSEHSVTSMHKDHYENMYAVIKGSKTFILHPPTDLPCIPYKHYQVCRYRKNQLGKYVISDDVNKEHCEQCCDEASSLINNEKDSHSIESNFSNAKTRQIMSNNKNNFVEAGNEVHKNTEDVCIGEINKMNVDIFLNETKEMHEMSNNYSSDIIKNNLNCKCTCHNPSTVPWVAIDPLCPDYNKYPLYKYANQLKVTLNPGELLYLPSLWFHHVEQTNETIALNFWYDMEYDIKYNYYKFVENLIHGHVESLNTT